MVTGTERGRRWDSEYVNCAVITRLLAEFQGFSRDLLTDAVDHVVDQFHAPPALVGMLRGAFVSTSALSKGNPTWTALTTDFGQLGLSLKSAVDLRYAVNGPRWRTRLDAALYARNAIAHADDDKLIVCRARHDLTMRRAREWRRSLNGLCAGLDAVVGTHLTQMTGVAPW